MVADPLSSASTAEQLRRPRVCRADPCGESDPGPERVWSAGGLSGLIAGRAAALHDRRLANTQNPNAPSGDVKKSLLVYDGSNSLFRAAAEAATHWSDEVVAVRWQATPIQAFLEAQFDARPFAFVLVEGDSVHVGEATIGRILNRMGLPEPLIDGLKRTYAVGSDPFGRLVHGRTVADLDGTFPLSAEAASHLEDLRQVREIPVQEAPTEEP
jgi:hypothetical protein